MSPRSSPRARTSAAAILAVVLAALTLAIGPTALPATATPGGGRTEEVETDPLDVEITGITPSTVPQGDGRITIRGTVTNDSVDEWTSLNLHVFTGAGAIPTSADLALAAESDPADYVGDRITTPGTFDTIDSLPPGESAEFTVRVPREELFIPDLDGVYWIGIHAIGDSSVPRDDFADGRARTFIAQVPRPADLPQGSDAQDPVRTATVVPVRAEIRYAADGSVADIDRWLEDLGPDGRLDQLLELDDLDGDVPLTWLVDPAVPSAIARIATGNPPRSLAPTGRQREDDSGSRGDGGGSGGQDPEDAPSPPTEEEVAAAELATAWLQRFTEALSDEPVLALPYGDLDADAAARHSPATLDRALELGVDTLATLDVASTPALAPPSGTISPLALARVSAGVVVLARDDAFSSLASGHLGVTDVDGQPVVVTSSGTAQGGPGPGEPDSALALRQRVLAEAALRRLGTDPAPVVTVLPDRWQPERPEAFFSRIPAWVEPVDVPTVLDSVLGGASVPNGLGNGRTAAPETEGQGDETLVPAATIDYDEGDRDDELPESTFQAVSGLRQPARLLDGILTDGGDIAQQTADEALTALSYDDRRDIASALARIQSTRAALQQQLAQVSVEAPSSVTLSSTSGRLGATVTNGLDEAVTVRVDAVTDGDLEMRGDTVVEIAPRSRTRLNLELTARRLGVHDVRLVVTDRAGRPIGSQASLPVRAVQVSEVIWVIMAIGGVMLFSAVLLRVVQRIRGRSRP